MLFNNKDKKGQGLAEYAIILGLIAIIVIAIMETISNNNPPVILPPLTQEPQNYIRAEALEPDLGINMGTWEPKQISLGYDGDSFCDPNDLNGDFIHITFENGNFLEVVKIEDNDIAVFSSWSGETSLDMSYAITIKGIKIKNCFGTRIVVQVISGSLNKISEDVYQYAPPPPAPDLKELNFMPNGWVNFTNYPLPDGWNLQENADGSVTVCDWFKVCKTFVLENGKYLQITDNGRIPTDYAGWGVYTWCSLTQVSSGPATMYAGFAVEKVGQTTDPSGGKYSFQISQPGYETVFIVFTLKSDQYPDRLDYELFKADGKTPAANPGGWDLENWNGTYLSFLTTTGQTVVIQFPFADQPISYAVLVDSADENCRPFP